MPLRYVTLIAVLSIGACSLSSPAIAPSTAGHLVQDHAGLLNNGLVQIVVEIPSGTNDKWQVNKRTGALEWEQHDGATRVIQYLGYPGNYGIIPQTLLPAELGGDGDPLDVLLLGPTLERGTVVQARAIAVLRLVDRGERDDKIIAVGVSGPLSDARSLEDLDANYPGVRTIIETWFTNYKGSAVATSNGYASADSAMAVVREASRYYRESKPMDSLRQ